MPDTSQQENQSSSNQNNSKETAKVMNYLAETANEIMDIVGWLGNKLNSNGSVFKIEDARGCIAEVCMTIPAGGVGEVTVILGQTRKNFPARAKLAMQEFKTGTKVKVADVAISTVYVEKTDL